MCTEEVNEVEVNEVEWSLIEKNMNYISIHKWQTAGCVVKSV